MSSTIAGSVAWFEEARRGCIDHLRALLSMRIALDSIAVILRDWGTADVVTKGALHAAAVVAYSRPFTDAQTKRGKIRYPIRHMQSANGFERKLHDHILDLRHRMIAHSDYGVFPSTMYFQVVGDEQLPLTLGLNVKGLMGFKKRDFAERYERHMSACASAIESALNDACNELVAQARLHPVEFQQTHNTPLDVREWVVDQTERELPPPTGPGATVESPLFSQDLAAYAYLQMTHQIPLVPSGPITFHVNGVPTEITLTVDDGIPAGPLDG